MAPMPRLTPQELKAALAGGLLAFPPTDFDAADALDTRASAARLEWLAGYQPAAFFMAGRRAGHWQFDLPGYLMQRLRQAGVAAEDLGLDTCADAARFFSYRRTTHAGEPDYGRQISAIALPA